MDKLKQFKTLGWYTITGQAKTCPECGVPRGGTPGHYWHLIRENTDDEARVQEIHGVLDVGPTDTTPIEVRTEGCTDGAD